MYIQNHTTHKSITQVQSSHKEQPEQFTDTQYKAGMYILHVKNNLNSSLVLSTRMSNALITQTIAREAYWHPQHATINHQAEGNTWVDIKRKKSNIITKDTTNINTWPPFIMQTFFYLLHCRHILLHVVYRHIAQLMHDDMPYNTASICQVDGLIIIDNRFLHIIVFN